MDWWYIILGIVAIPAMFKLLPHFGINQYWALFCILPVGTVVLLWVMAMKLQELEKR